MNLRTDAAHEHKYMTCGGTVDDGNVEKRDFHFFHEYPRFVLKSDKDFSLRSLYDSG